MVQIRPLLLAMMSCFTKAEVNKAIAADELAKTEEKIALKPRTVAAFYAAVIAAVRGLL